MTRPRIICHMHTLLNGKIDGIANPTPAGMHSQKLYFDLFLGKDRFYSGHRGWLSGSGTSRAIMGGFPQPELPPPARAGARRRPPGRSRRSDALLRGGPLGLAGLGPRLVQLLRRRRPHRRADPEQRQRRLQGAPALRRGLLSHRRRGDAGHGDRGAPDRRGLRRGRADPGRRRDPELVHGPRRAVR